MFINVEDWEDLDYIFDLSDECKERSYLSDISERGFEVYKQRMNFFKPFEDRPDFFTTYSLYYVVPLLFQLAPSLPPIIHLSELLPWWAIY